MNFLKKLGGIFGVGGLFCFALIKKEEVWKWQSLLKPHVFSGCFLPDICSFSVPYVSQSQETHPAAKAYPGHSSAQKTLICLLEVLSVGDCGPRVAGTCSLSHTERPLCLKDVIAPGAAGLPSHRSPSAPSDLCCPAFFSFPAPSPTFSLC